jgi:hypothetical protein
MSLSSSGGKGFLKTWNSPGKASSKDVLELEEISFALHKIAVVRKDGRSSMDDDGAVVA